MIFSGTYKLHFAGVLGGTPERHVVGMYSRGANVLRPACWDPDGLGKEVRLLRRRFAGRSIDDWLPPDHRQTDRPAALSDEVLQAIRTVVREEISHAGPAFGVKR